MINKYGNFYFYKKQLSMKRLKNLKYLLIAAVLPMVMNSCLDSDDPDFACYPYGYMVQTFVGGGAPRYAVYLNVSSNEDMVKVDCAKGTTEPYFLTKLNSRLWELSENYMSYRSEMPNGTYNFSVTNAESEVASNYVKLDIDKGMSEIKLKKFEMKNGNISMEVEPVENASAYCLMISPAVRITEGGPLEYKRCNNQYYYWGRNSSSNLLPSSGTLNLREIVNQLYGRTLTEEDVVYIAFAAVRAESGQGMLIQETTIQSVTIKTEKDFISEQIPR